jgi:hypothetical protein
MSNRKLRVYNIPLTLPSPPTTGERVKKRGAIRVENYAF